MLNLNDTLIKKIPINGSDKFFEDLIYSIDDPYFKYDRSSSFKPSDISKYNISYGNISVEKFYVDYSHDGGVTFRFYFSYFLNEYDIMFFHSIDIVADDYSSFYNQSEYLNYHEILDLNKNIKSEFKKFIISKNPIKFLYITTKFDDLINNI